MSAAEPPKPTVPIHAGFDAKPGTLKAKLNVEGNAMMDTLSKDLDIPFVRNGSLVVCTDEQDASELERLLEQGKETGSKTYAFLTAKPYTPWNQI